MSEIEKIQFFENRKVRTAWDEEKQEWFFSIVDVCGVLTDQPTHERARNYWKVLKNRLRKEGSEVVTNCNRLKLIAEDGKPRFTDVESIKMDGINIRYRNHHKEWRRWRHECVA